VNGRGLVRHYEALTGEERFRLVMLAKARRDRTEVGRLVRACPLRSYRGADAAYTARWEMSHLVVDTAALELTQYLAKLEVARAFLEVARAFANGVGNRAALAFANGHDLAVERAREATGGADDWSWAARPDARSHAGLAAAHASGREPFEVLVWAMGELASRAASRARDVWDGFGRFSRDEVGLEPEEFMGAHLPSLVERVRSHQAALDEAEPDPLRVVEYARELAEAWRVGIGRTT
jgi:hypothetical protein